MVPLAEIETARARLPSAVIRTPLLYSEELSERAGAPIYFKCENLQVTGSYKARAAFTILDRLGPEQRPRGAALSSSGNFASAFAYMGRLLGIPTAVVMMEKTARLKVEKCRRYGAEIVFCPNQWEERWRTLDRLQSERGILAVNTFESEAVIAGHGTLGLEIMDDLPEVGTVLVPVSSGGLIGGLATAVKERRPAARVVGVQPTGSNAATLSFQRGEVTRIPAVETICDALIAQAPGHLPFAHIQRYVDEMALVSDDETKAAIAWLAENAKLVVEAGGAVAAAALLTRRVRPQGPSVCLLSGGNIAPATLSACLAEAA
ncbi:MAG: threonine/serine dehydratase [Armatimonadetes bacterium]|nr:threonine/serine dehydratase [Armatimonadota bacterium]